MAGFPSRFRIAKLLKGLLPREQTIALTKLVLLLKFHFSMATGFADQADLLETAMPGRLGIFGNANFADFEVPCCR